MSDFKANTSPYLYNATSCIDATHYGYPDSSFPQVILPAKLKEAFSGLKFFFPLKKQLKIMLSSIKFYFPTIAVSGYRETDIAKELKEIAGRSDAQTALLIGNPGPYAKDTLLIMGGRQKAIAVAKHGISKASRELLKNEAYWLRRLNASHLGRCVPSLLSKLETESHITLVMSPGLGQFLTRKEVVQNIGFLSSLQSISTKYDHYKTSLMRHRMKARKVSLADKLSPSWEHRVSTTFNKIDEGLNKETIPFVSAHRDFVPWNMRLTTNGLFVFDWEYASDGYIPLYDLFHLFLIQHAIWDNLSFRKLTRILHVIINVAKRLPDAINKLHKPDYQLLAYLLDVCLFYLESNEGDDTNDQVVQCYSRIVDRFDDWKIK